MLCSHNPNLPIQLELLFIFFLGYCNLTTKKIVFIAFNLTWIIFFLNHWLVEFAYLSETSIWLYLVAKSFLLRWRWHRGLWTSDFKWVKVFFNQQLFQAFRPKNLHIYKPYWSCKVIKTAWCEFCSFTWIFLYHKLFKSKLINKI